MTTAIYGQDTIPIGGGEVAKIGGMIHINTTAVGTDADTAEKVLMSYPLPANTLLKDGQGVRVKMWGKTGANANTKQLRLYFGASGLVIDTGAVVMNDNNWILEAEIFRTGVGTQGIVGRSQRNVTLISLNVADKTEDETAAIIIKMTGVNGTASANDIICEGMKIEFLNAE